MADRDNEESFRFHWKIENVSIWVSETNSTLRSPIFRTNSTNCNEEWDIQLKAYNSENTSYMRLILRKSDGKELKTIVDFDVPSCELSLLTDDGAVLRYFKKKVPKISHNCAFFDFLINRKAIYLPNDTLTIRSKLWTFKNSQCSVRTVLHQKKFFWNIESFSKSSITTKTIKLASRQFTIKCENRLRKCESVRFVTSVTNDENLNLAHCKIVNVHNNRLFPVLMNYDIICSREIATASPHLIDDTLYLQCDFNVGNSEISYEDPKSVSTGQIFKSKNSTCLSTALRDGLLRLYFDSKFCDATLKTGDAIFPVHRIVLCARSSVFCAMFDSDTVEGQTGVVHTPDLNPDTLKRMLMFAYTDSLENLHWDEASKLYYAAEKYDIRPLKEACLSVMKAGLSVSNAYDALVLADTHQDKDLLKCVLVFIEEHEEVMNSSEWKELEEHNAKLKGKVLHEVSRGKK